MSYSAPWSEAGPDDYTYDKNPQTYDNPLNTIADTSSSGWTAGGKVVPSQRTIIDNTLTPKKAKKIFICSFPIPTSLSDNPANSVAFNTGKFTYYYYFWMYSKLTLATNLGVRLCNTYPTCNVFPDKFGTSSNSASVYAIGDLFSQEYIAVTYGSTPGKISMSTTGANTVIFIFIIFNLLY